MTNLIDLYPHNKVVFNKVLENLKTHNKVGVVQATGTGKGKLAACFVEYLVYHKSNAKILIVAPLRSILQNYRDNFDINYKAVDFITYQKLNKLSNDVLVEYSKKYDLIVLDEFHRCGAHEWGKKIEVIFNNLNKSTSKILGLTATPIRYLDGFRDMGVELFDGNIIEGLGIAEAISDGVLPSFTYHACYYGVESLLKGVSSNLHNNSYGINSDSVRKKLIEEVRKLSLVYENRYKIENIIKEGTKHLGVNQKWVIFCKDKENLQEIYKYCSNWFIQQPKLYVLYSNNSISENDKILSSFRKENQGISVLLCINMLNEGVHIKDLNGVIMLRKTDSPILFLQQLGRSLEVGKSFNPIIFDLIGNYRGYNIEKLNIESNPIAIIKAIKNKTESGKNHVIIYNFIEELDNILEKIYSLKDGCWAPEEDDIVLTYYPIGYYKLCQEKGLNRTKASIINRAGFLGLRESNFYSEDELKILNQYYPIGGANLCQEKGLNRSKSAIISKAGSLGLDTGRNIPFDEWEDSIIIEFYQMGGAILCQEKGLNRSVDAIRRRASKLGLIKTKKSNYTKYEDKVIEKYYSIGGSVLCQEKLQVECDSYRTISAIEHRAQRLGVAGNLISPWSKKEDNIILKYYSDGGWSLCVDKGLKNRTRMAIQRRAGLLGVNYETRLWSEKDDNIIRTYYPVGGSKLCIQNGLSHRTETSIFARAQKIGVSRKDKKDL